VAPVRVRRNLRQTLPDDLFAWTWTLLWKLILHPRTPTIHTLDISDKHHTYFSSPRAHCLLRTHVNGLISLRYLSTPHLRTRRISMLDAICLTILRRAPWKEVPMPPPPGHYQPPFTCLLPLNLPHHCTCPCPFYAFLSLYLPFSTVPGSGFVRTSGLDHTTRHYAFSGATSPPATSVCVAPRTAEHLASQHPAYHPPPSPLPPTGPRTVAH